MLIPSDAGGLRGAAKGEGAGEGGGRRDTPGALAAVPRRDAYLCTNNCSRLILSHQTISHPPGPREGSGFLRINLDIVEGWAWPEM